MAQKAVVAIIGRRSTCSYCRALGTLTGNGTKLAAELPDFDVIDADASAPAVYNKWRTASKASGDIPIIAVFDEALVLKGKFVARNMTLATIVGKIKALCPDCSTGGAGSGDDDGCCGGTCPKCGAHIEYCPSCGTDLCTD